MKRPSLILAALLSLGCAKPETISPKPSPIALDAASSAPTRSSWDPKKTRVFVVCLARFKGEADGATSFSLNDRNDTTFVSLLEARGVPKENIVFLMDQDATRDKIKARFTELLQKSAPDETLLFYFGSHGGYDPETGEHTFSTFESTIPMEWALDAIDDGFKGSRAIMFADSCYSGGLATRAAKRKGHIVYTVLGSTAPQQVAWSQWRFVDSLIKGFSGDPLVDINADGAVTFSELSAYTGKRLAFAAEGKPTSLEGEPNLILAEVTDARQAPHGGRYVEAKSKSGWYKAEVLETHGDESFIHYTSYDNSWDEWVKPERVREFQFEQFKPGQNVEAAGASSGDWYKAKVLERWESLHLVHWDGYSDAYDEWVGPSRIRPAK